MESTDIILVIIAGLLVGMSKAGLKGLGIITVALMVAVFGARQSTGLLLPLLLVGDVMAVIYYKRDVRWPYLAKFLPAMIAGVIVAVWIGKDLPEDIFKKLMGGVILISVLIMFWWDFKGKSSIPNNWLIAGSSGIAAGFATMIGNLAGPFANMFFLATRIPKKELIGTTAWLFFIINIIKVPFHVFSWETIKVSTLVTDLYIAPTIFIGFILGLKIVSLINERYYRIFLLIATALGAISIFF